MTKKYSGLFYILLWLLVLQALLLAVKQMVFSYRTETFFSRSMVTMLCMAALTVALIFFCRRRGWGLSVFPEKFSLPYIIFTAAAAVFYVLTLFFVNTFTLRSFLILFYGSLVTPVFEELLFRGVIWNRLNRIFGREWLTYLTVTALFALWHIGYAVGLYLWNGGSLMGAILGKVSVGAIFGLITGALRYKTKNCYCGILVHGILNAIG